MEGLRDCLALAARANLYDSPALGLTALTAEGCGIT